MKTTFLSAWLLLCLGSSLVPVADPPQVELSNGTIQTTLYLPDEQQGYYQGNRFDWAGAFKSLTYKGHRFVDQWFEKYDPKIHDAINGPVEEFTPLGYPDAKSGDTFVKIGVGVLRKVEDKPYSFGANYDVVDRGKWSVKQAEDRESTEAITFTHTLTDANGYGYLYTKTVRLSKDKPELTLEHSLKNTGQKPIETSVYNHNFFVIDKQPTGPQITVRFPFAVTATEGRGFGSTINPQGNSLVYARDLEKKETVYTAGLRGFGPTAKDYDIRIENLKTGAGVHITGDQPLEKMVYWACATTSCPEPYIRLQAAPGQTVNWKLTYEFYEKTNP